GERGRVKFISRGDGSGTHVREMMIWRMAGLKPGGDWYMESGQGMAQTLVMASELGAYTLSDIGTYLALKGEGRLEGLEILYTNSSELINIYSIYYTSSCKEGEWEAARGFMEFIISNQDLIEEYNRVAGGPLFHPAKGADWLGIEWRRLAGYQG
ncbi:MAG: tungsten ABC transporter permease, partial [Desulfurococcales archaeon]|nr:tungsten ABC transporter permease [Desulfurococcales archaeon]